MGQTMYVTGYPFQAGLKIDVNGHYYGYPEEPLPNPPSYSGITSLPFSNIHTFGGSSGSPIYNRDDEAIEIISTTGMNATYEYNTVQECDEPVHQPGFNTVIGALPDIETLLPREELSVTPLTRIVHVAPVGGMLANPVNTYTIQGYPLYIPPVTPPPVTPKNRVIVSAPTTTSPPGARPTLTGSWAGKLSIASPSGSTTLTLTADIASVTSCGAWDFVTNVKDDGNDYNFPIHQRFEIGLREARMTPKQNWVIEGLARPYGATKIYTLTNPRPDSVTLELTTSESWLLVNGVASTTITLGPAGSATDHANVTVSFSSVGLDILPPGVRNRASLVTTYTTATCLATPGSIVRGVTVFFGSASFVVDTDVDLELPIVRKAWGQPSVVSLPLNYPGLCIDDLKVGFSFANATTGGGTVANIRALLGKTGDHRLLWQGGFVPSTSYLNRGYLSFDDAVTPPTAGTLLSYFNGMELNGSWEVAYQANLGYVSGYWMPDSLTLTLTASNCP